MASKRVKIAGRVQGVSYRAWTEERAVGLGLDGWVRNRSGGWVEALFAGDQDLVEQILAECLEGPRAARVEAVEVLAENEASEPGFRVLPTE
ncbi:acylphosphatase [Lutibaculum baratangense]|uniref:acylphosphatase n=1 Tax=Lutibaculum baratangense AMV1 TaxID=631454 RepID=V4R3M8_9HYPH|nr:acylphosphatase [Lutibaculum baratangense]ESR26552.1 putative Acylphosphate phosphohydrolase [Lutibaculum baratangense AMV1]